MVNRWDAREAEGTDGLDQLVFQSRLLGADEDLVLWGGGNTSLKLAETDFRGRETRVLRVKGSGSDMKSIERKHFAGVRLEDVLPLEARDDMSDEEMVAYLAHTLMSPTDPRPSIETLLHAFVPYPSVAHSHADAIVALTNSVRGREAVRDCFGADALIVDYIRPGFLLSKQVGAAARENPAARALVLMNHGFITWAATPKEAYDIHIAMVTRAEEYLAERSSGKSVFAAAPHRGMPAEERHRLAAQVGPILRGAVIQAARELGAPPLLGAGGPRVVLRYDDSPEVLEFAGSTAAAELSQIGPGTPDHLLHTKRVPLCVPAAHWSELADLSKLRSSIQAAARAWTAGYAAYFEAHARGEQMLEPTPRIALLPGIGMFTLGKDAKSASVPADIYRHTVKIIAVGEALGGYRSISPKEAFAVEYWPLELYKLSLAPPERDLARRIALITGATGAIGAAIADRFAAEGCHVVVTDLYEERCATAAAAICAKYGAGRAIGVAMDVSSEESVRAAFEQAALAYGGLDILVSNAGVAHSARIDELELAAWQRSFDVNATGHFLVAREAVRLFRAQGIGGNIVFNVTKNALAAGAEFGAYSAAKAAELQLARVLAIENGAHGIRVNMLNPDAIFSAGLWSDEMKAKRAAAQGIDPSQVEEHYRQRNLLKAQVTAEDVAEAALWLASDRSAKTTGCIIPVDGGIREAFPR